MTKTINDAMSALAMFALDTDMSNIDQAISHVKTISTQLAEEVNEETATHFEILSFKILYNKI